MPDFRMLFLQFGFNSINLSSQSVHNVLTLLQEEGLKLIRIVHLLDFLWCSERKEEVIHFPLT